jgi:hypothetical protein
LVEDDRDDIEADLPVVSARATGWMSAEEGSGETSKTGSFRAMDRGEGGECSTRGATTGFDLNENERCVDSCDDVDLAVA